MVKLNELTSPELLAIRGDIAEELRRRGILRSSINPVADLSEHLFCRAFGLDAGGKLQAIIRCAEGCCTR